MRDIVYENERIRMSIPLSVVVVAKNEEANIDECLGSVFGWAGEIVVVDDESTDRTAALTRKYTDKIYHRKMDVEGTHRNWAYAQASNEWVLSLDADERLTQELRDEISAVLVEPEYQLYTIPRRNYIGDYWVRYGGQYPSAQLRLFRKECFRYEETYVHPRVFLTGTTGHLKSDLLHYSYRDFGHFLQKLNAQTTMEARKWVEDKRKATFGKSLWRSIDRFFRGYVRKQGYKDGFIGFMVAYFSSIYQVISYAKYWQMKQKNVMTGKG
ncbi:MAG TPA: glycosyltransferase family 2 protein [Candidatus Bathyarchaeia archaeon]|nr:glycosyltransferase family 2 protein [Candidatus Bathyarchaeia archaeon]